MKENKIALAQNEALKLIEEGVNELETICHEQRLEIKQLRAERDEARKQICESHSRNYHQACQHAIECNWDCYKETPCMMNDLNTGFLGYVKEA